MVPLVFVSLVVGISNLTSDKQLASISFKAISLYLCTTAIAIISALFVSSFFDMSKIILSDNHPSDDRDVYKLTL